MKKLIAIILTVLLLAPTAAGAFADGSSGIETLKINPYGGAESEAETISWRLVDGRYYLFMPSDTDPAASKVYFSAKSPIALDGKKLTSGGSAELFTEGSHTLTCGGASLPLTVCFSANLPAVYITTESGSLDYIHADKENKEPGAIRIYENGAVSLDKPLKQMKGRGNTTWAYKKRPYNIKFDKKTEVLGMDKAKKWTLLANYIDLSLIHNAFGWEFAAALGMPYTGDYRYVDLYVNGDYLGNYVICESVEIDENRVDLTDLEKANEKANPGVDIESLPRGFSDPAYDARKGSRKWIEIPKEPDDVTGGYLLEFDYDTRYAKELCGFVTENGQPVVIKSPEYASHAEVNYIADYMEAGTEALYSSTGYNSAGRHYSEYFDLDSFVASYILHELAVDHDAGLSSFFAFKPSGDEKICFGPVWDMDNGFGSPYSNFKTPLISTDIWWANQITLAGRPGIFTAANRHADFRALVREKWASLVKSGALDDASAAVAGLAGALVKSGTMNGLRWGLYDAADMASAADAFKEQADISLDFVTERTAVLCRGFGANGAYLYYDVNASTKGDWASVSPVSVIGESVTVRDITDNCTIAPSTGKIFYCWNTKADGSGENYYPGDNLTLKGECTVLYAIWKTQFEMDAINRVNHFTDVSKDAYYYDATIWAHYHDPQITGGTSATSFSPDADCTRAQAVTMLWASLGKETPAAAQSSFKDVKKTDWFYLPVVWAKERGITEGVGGGIFGVKQSCTRAQIVTFLWKSAGSPSPKSRSCPFTDVKRDAYYRTAVIWAYENGITSGTSDTTFSPGKKCSRAQIVTFLYKKSLILS